MGVATSRNRNSTTDFREKNASGIIVIGGSCTLPFPALELLFDGGTGRRVLGAGMNGVVFVALGLAVAWGSRAPKVGIYTLWPPGSPVTRL